MRKLGFYSLAIAVVAVALGVLSPARAKADTFNFGSPTGVLGFTQLYTGTTGGTILAVGAFCATNCLSQGGGTGFADLYGKNLGGGEQGVGIAGDPDGANEISDDNYVSLGLLGRAGTLVVESVQPGQSFVVCFGSNYAVFTTCGSPLPTTFNAANNTYDVSIPSGIGWVSVTGAVNDTGSESTVNDDVLVSSFTTTPEPGTLALLAIGLLGLGGLMFSRRKFGVGAVAA